jgi:glutaredoxin
VAAAVAALLAVGAFAWSRITPDMSMITRLFPAPPAASDTPAAVEPTAASAQATEQAEPQRAAGEPSAPAPEQQLALPGVDTTEDPAALARRMQNQIEEKKERLAHARRNVSVTMYSTSWCKVCRDARSYLKEASTAFDDYDVDVDRDADRRLRAINPRHTVPTFDIDGAVLTGWSPGAFESMLTSAAARRAERE